MTCNSLDLNNKIISRTHDDIEDYINVAHGYFMARKYDEDHCLVSSVTPFKYYKNALEYPTWDKQTRREYGQYRYISIDKSSPCLNKNLFMMDLNRSLHKLSIVHDIHAKRNIMNKIYYIIFSYSKALYEYFGKSSFFTLELYMKPFEDKSIYKSIRKYEGRSIKYNKTFQYFVSRFC